MPESWIPPEDIEKTLFGVRQPGDAGWRIAEWACKVEELAGALATRSVTYETFRVIHRSWSRPEFVGVLMAERAIEHGWLLDPAERLWHPPDEPLPEPEGTPVPVQELELGVQSIRFGCVHLAIRADTQRAELYCDDVDDPFPQLVRWVRGIEHGAEPHAVVMQGFDWVELHAFNTAEPNTVRLLVRGKGRFEERRIDALMGRKILTKRMRRLLRQIADHPNFPVHFVCHASLGGEQESLYDTLLEPLETAFEERSRMGRLTDDDYDAQDEAEARALAEGMPLTPEQMAHVEKYRRMIVALEVPEGWW